MTNNYFETQAANWDTPARIARAGTIAGILLENAHPAPDCVAIDYGTGTGLLAFAMAPHVGHIIGLDNSPAMLEVLQEKCRATGTRNLEGRLFDIGHDRLAPACCDLFVSNMVLHHLESPEHYAQIAWKALRPGGLAVVVDLDSDGGDFHKDDDGAIHPGFERDALGRIFISAGFSPARFTTAYTIRKQGRSGIEQDFTLFMLIARKSEDPEKMAPIQSTGA